MVPLIATASWERFSRTRTNEWRFTAQEQSDEPIKRYINGMKQIVIMQFFSLKEFPR
jgi:hypothetical protein